MGSPDNPLNFYSVILSDDVQETGLKMPETFTAKHGGKMKSVVVLNLPDGCSWQIGLVNSDGVFWLRSGWSEFAEHYGLCYGDFLVFKYQGNSIFQVIICDRTASEIEYPGPKEIPVNSSAWREPPATNSRRSKSKKAKTISISSEEEESDDIEDEDGDCFPQTNSPTRSDSPEKYSPRSEKGKTILISSETEEESEEEEEEDEDDDEDDETFSNSSMEETEDEAESRFEGKPRRGKTSKIIAKSRAFASAKAFQSDYPFFFSSMTKYYISGKRGLLIQRRFINRYWRNFKNNKLCVLQLSNGETWGSIEGLSYSLPTSGWKRFIDDNAVKEGDVCVCELIDRKRNVLKVHIFRADASDIESMEALETPVNDSSGGRNHHRSYKGVISSKALVSVKLEENAVSSSCMEQTQGMRKKQGWSHNVGKRIAFESAKAFESDNPTFVVSMTPYNISGNRGLIIPHNVLDREWNDFRRNGKCVIQLSNGETWGSIDTNKCSLSASGWKKFVDDNCIKNGDACVFELINNEQCLVRIHIFRSV